MSGQARCSNRNEVLKVSAFTKAHSVRLIGSLVFALFLVFGGILSGMAPVWAQSGKVGASGLPLPRFVSFRAVEVNLRSGPGVRYPILWVFQRRGLPVEIVDEFDTWRQIRDAGGTTGWVHQSMLQGRRSVLVQGQGEQILRKQPGLGAAPVARLEPGVVARLDHCTDENWCRVEVQSFSGWLPRDTFYGTYQNEIYE